MQVTEEMVRAAIKKAIEAGWIPRNALQVDVDYNLRIMREILQTAADTSASKFDRASPSVRRNTRLRS